MKKSAMKIALLALVAASFSMFGAHASDPFGSSESGGTVSCPGGTAVPNVGTVYAGTGSTKGVEGCAPSGSGSQLPIRGRVGAYTDGSKVTVFADGSDNNPAGGASGWDRVTVSASQQCVDRGDSGTYDSGAAGNSLHVCH